MNPSEDRLEVPFYSDMGLHLLCHETSQPVAVVAVPSGTLLETNKAFSGLLERTFDRSGDVSILDLATATGARRISRTIEKWSGEGEQWIEGVTLRTRGGGKVRGRAGLMPIPGSFPAMAFFQFVQGRKNQEIRLRRLLDDRIEQLRNLERLRSLGEVTAILVHEIRTPLTSIRVGAEGVLRSPHLDPKLHRRMENVLEQIHRIDHLLTGIREFGRPFPLSLQTLPVRDILEGVRETVGARFPEIRWSVRVQPKDLAVHADPDRLREALENLAVNSAEATEGTGTVRLSAGQSRLRKGWTEIRVVDDGPGLSSEDTSRAFQLFYTTKRTGAGLGLSIVKKIVDLHAGFVRLTGEKEGGTRVSLDFPPESARRP